MPKVTDLINRYNKDNSKTRRRKRDVKSLIAMYEGKISSVKEKVAPWKEFKERKKGKNNDSYVAEIIDQHEDTANVKSTLKITESLEMPDSDAETILSLFKLNNADDK